MEVREIQFVTPVYPEKLDDFSVEITEEWINQDTGDVSWSALVTGSNGASFAVENNGEGERNSYIAFDKQGELLLERFYQCSEEAYDPDAYDSGLAQILEEADLAIIWIEIRDLDPSEITNNLSTDVVKD